jgi:hypothetical protein
MFQSLSIFTRLPLKDLEILLKQHQDDFEELLGDTFSENELEGFENLLDQISSPVAQPISSDLSFSDFEILPEFEMDQHLFFNGVKSCLLLENVSDPHFNPFQVTYIKEILRVFDEVLIDRGGFHPLLFKKPFLETLKGHKNIFSLVKDDKSLVSAPVFDPLNPIDVLVADVYRELHRLNKRDLRSNFDLWPEKARSLYEKMMRHHYDSPSLFQISKLSPKDFGDNLEKLKFILRKIEL